MLEASRTYRTPFIVGLPVAPEQFYGRREQVEQFYGQCILGPVLQPTRILGLKRSGKTSFLNYISDADVKKRFLRATPSDSVSFVYLNAQAIRTRNEFYDTVVSGIHEQVAHESQKSSGIKTGIAFQKQLYGILRANTNTKIIVLIDEFEKLHESDEFDVEFFGLLRALVSANSSNFTWVTASAVDLYTLDRSQKTSPFWNVFHQMPIIMGGFREEDAQLLIKESLKTINVPIAKYEINDIIALSGKIPYFVQAVADTWHKLRETQGIPLKKVKTAILDMLSNPSNQIQHIYRLYWDEMDESRRIILRNIASERRNISASYSDLITLCDYGLIVGDNIKYGRYKISGELLKQFIADINSENMTSASKIHIDARGGTIIGGDVQTNGGSFVSRDQVNSGIDANQLFELIYNAIDKKAELGEGDKTDLKQDVQELQQELLKDDKTNQSYAMRRLRSIGRMAPDILEVTLATITNPAAGFGIVAKKIVDKIKDTSSK